MSSEELSQTVLDLLSEGAKAYSKRDFEKAVEIYAEACETYNGETDGDDSADLLFLYGKSLFHLAVSNSEVLGGSKKSDPETKKAEKHEKEEDSDEKKDKTFQFDDDVIAEEEEEEEEEEKEKEKEEDNDNEEQEEEEDDDDDDESDANDKKNENEEEETDFEAAWNILDLARSLFEKQLEEFSSKDKLSTAKKLEDQEAPTDPYLIMKKKLSETYDILGEVSLEAENYLQASTDFDASLVLRKELYHEYSALISESYYKLSLSYEFLVDVPGSREKAVECMESAIRAVKSNPTPQDTEVTEEVLLEMNYRLEDLRKDPLKEEKEKIMKGLLGEVIAEAGVSGKELFSGSASTSSLTSTTGAAGDSKKVNDLTSVVKKRKGPKVMKPSKKLKK